MGAGSPALSATGSSSEAAAFRAVRDRAEQMWTTAEGTKTALDWDDAAAAYAAAAAMCSDRPDCSLLAYGEVLARKNAYRLETHDPPDGVEPVALPPRVDAMMASFDRYAEQYPDSDEALGVRFLAASTVNRYRHHDDAVTRLKWVVLHGGTSELTEYAANLLLDTLNQQGRYDELEAWVIRLLADSERMARFPALEATLKMLTSKFDE